MTHGIHDLIFFLQTLKILEVKKTVRTEFMSDVLS